MRNDASTSQGSGLIVLATTILGSSMAFIDGTVVNVALPVLQNAFHASITDAQWVVESYELMVAALLLVGGSLGDTRGFGAESAESSKSRSKFAKYKDSMAVVESEANSSPGRIPC
jgi:MFS family permease